MSRFLRFAICDLRFAICSCVALAVVGGGLGCGGPDVGRADVGDAGGDAQACIEGEACDDGNPCTHTDTCTGGVCLGTDYAELCAVPDCAEGGCDGEGGCLEPVVKEGWCLVVGACVAAGEPNPANACEVCAPPEKSDGFVEAETGAACQDGNVCTENDYCDSGDCLAGSPPTCPDGVQCTQDSCDAENGCIHVPLHDECKDDNPCTADSCDAEAGGCVNLPDDSAFCGDGDVCTLNDRCESGKCVTDPEPVQCDDSNVCTDETCHPSYGCLYVFNEVFCDDGATCTSNDKCSFGRCEGEEDSWWNPCPACDLTFSDQIAKVNKLRVGDGGHPGEALNVDNDFKTCSPPGNCEQGLDNSLTLAGDFIDQIISDNLANMEGNPLIFLAELVEPSFSGEAFDMNIFYAGLSDENPGCDFQQDKCIYNASTLNFNAICLPQVAFKNATVKDGVLDAGGSGYIFPFKMSFVNGKEAVTVLYAARVKAAVDVDGDDNVTKLSGVLGGAITSENLVELIEAIPEEYMTLDKDVVITFVKNLPQDIDLDGNGKMDASSIALVFETIPGVLNPYYY